MGIALSELTIHIFLKNGPSFSIGIKRKSFIYLPYLLLMIYFCNRRRLQLIIFGLLIIREGNKLKLKWYQKPTETGPYRGMSSVCGAPGPPTSWGPQPPQIEQVVKVVVYRKLQIKCGVLSFCNSWYVDVQTDVSGYGSKIYIWFWCCLHK